MASARPLRRPRPVATTRTRTRPRPRHAGQRYTEAGALYGIPHWGKGFFHVDDEGDLVEAGTVVATIAGFLKPSEAR